MPDDMWCDLPATAAWRHCEAREGFESVFLRSGPSGHVLEGHVVAVEDGRVWAVRYAIEMDAGWTTRTVRAWGRRQGGGTELRLDVDRSGRWHANGVAVPGLDGCLDVDLEASACTNTIPVHRLRLDVGRSAEAPAVYVRAPGLGVERLEQRYTRVDDDGAHKRYDYEAPAFEYTGRLVYDGAGLIVEYPGIASRVI